MRRTAVYGRGSKSETRVGLFTTTGGFIENGVVNFGDNDVVLEIESGIGRLRESVEV